MRYVASSTALALSLCLASLGTSTRAAAQQPPPGPPPPPAAYSQGQPPPVVYNTYNAPLRVQAEVLPRKITDWEEGEPIPPGYRVSTEPRRGLVIAGSITLGTVWLFTALGSAIAISASNSFSDGSACTSACSAGWGFVPVVGPFVMAAAPNEGGAALLVFDGVLQAAGAAMLIAGLTARRTVLVREYAGVTFKATPIVGQNQTGLSLKATF